MSEMNWYWVYNLYLDEPERQDESALGWGYSKVYFKSEADAVIAENEAENRKLKYALWLARAERAREAFFKWNLFPNFETVNKLLTIDEYDETPGATDGRVLRTCIEWIKIWNNVERKCRAKAEQYKEEK